MHLTVLVGKLALRFDRSAFFLFVGTYSEIKRDSHMSKHSSVSLRPSDCTSLARGAPLVSARSRLGSPRMRPSRRASFFRHLERAPRRVQILALFAAPLL